MAIAWNLSGVLCGLLCAADQPSAGAHPGEGRLLSLLQVTHDLLSKYNIQGKRYASGHALLPLAAQIGPHTVSSRRRQLFSPSLPAERPLATQNDVVFGCKRVGRVHEKRGPGRSVFPLWLSAYWLYDMHIYTSQCT